MSETTKKGKAGQGWLRRNAIRVVIGLIAIVALIIITKIPARNRAVPPGEAPPVNVKVMTVTAEPELVDTFDLPAVVEPNRIVNVSAEVAGRIEQIPLKKGNPVRAGDILVRLNQDLMRPEYEIAKAQVKRDQIEFDRMDSLVKGSAAPPRDLDNATTQLAISKARFEEIKARLERTSIVAPNAGLLNDVLVEEGEYVQEGKSLAEVVDTETVKVVVDVPERDIAYFAVGQKAEVFANVKGQERLLAGIIAFISELADQRTRSTRMEVRVDNKEGLLRSGQIVRVHLTRGILKDAIFIPLLAVIPMEDGKAVYVANSDTANRREVILGIIKGDRVQVTNGLKTGEKLIVAGHRFVAPGQKVNIIKDDKESK